MFFFSARIRHELANAREKDPVPDTAQLERVRRMRSRLGPSSSTDMTSSRTAATTSSSGSSATNSTSGADISSPLPFVSGGAPNPLIAWRPASLSLRRSSQGGSSVRDDVRTLLALGKARLSLFNVLVAAAGYALCPFDPAQATRAAVDQLAASLADSTASSASSAAEAAATMAAQLDAAALLSAPTLSVLWPMAVGTALCAFSAASLNQLIEAPYDAQMPRTRNRPLPARVVSPLHAASFAALTGTAGLATLASINLPTAAIGLATVVLYCPFYTLMKRHSIWNTWLGAVVGALPPLIGWAACTGDISPWTQPGAWALFATLFAWQFPHFNALAHSVRSAYAVSGYRMLAVLDARLNARVALRYAIALVPISLSYPVLGLTNAWFPLLCASVNVPFVLSAWRFDRERTDRRAKELFFLSLFHLPIWVALALLTKTGLWDNFSFDRLLLGRANDEVRPATGDAFGDGHGEREAGRVAQAERLTQQGLVKRV